MRFLVDCPPKNHKSANAIMDDKIDLETTKEQIKKILRFFNM